MALTSWKSFDFFDVSRTQVPNGDGSVPLDQGSVTHVAAGSKYVFVASENGTIHALQQTFASVRSWKAHEDGRITHISQIPDTSYLVTLSEDLSHEPELKAWDLEHNEKKTSSPKCLCTLTVQNGRRNFPVTALAVTNDLAQVAVGFANGSVTLVRGDLIHERGTRQRTVFETKDSVTGLVFREDKTSALYISTTSQLHLLAMTGNKQGAAARKLDDKGCALGCMTIDLQSNEIIVARDDAVYFYGSRGKLGAYAYECSKTLLRISTDYILLISPSNNASGRSGLLRAFGGSQAQDILNSTSFKMLNTHLKFIAHEELLSAQVNTLFSIWGATYVLTVDGKVFRYHEKTFQQKLDILYRRDDYILAIELAKRYKVGTSELNAIYRKYGDFLYQKGDYETAMQQYLQAIDNTEPSQIIRKFLDNQSIQFLIEYLEELHDHHRATSDHTTLLLNCYAKLKDIEKLENFIRQPGELRFDLDIAISMCRQAGYYDQAAFLARRHEGHGMVVDILIEDLKKYAEALAYIVRLGPADAYENIMKYGTVLLEHCSRDTTQLFIEYFTGVFTPKKDAVITQETPNNQDTSRIGNLAQSAVQNLAALIPLPYMNASSPESLVRPSDGTKATVNQIVETAVDGDFVEYQIPKPRVAFPAFIDHTDEFIVFLKACIDAENVAPENKADLYTTLFEMYLHKASMASGEQKEDWEAKARSLIESKDVDIDTSNVLLLSDLEKFRDGSILVGEKNGRYFDIFRSYTSAKDTRGAIKALHKYGPEEPQLYPAALAYFTSDPQILAEAGSVEIDSVLQKIDDEGLMAPLQVIQTLSITAVATMGLVKKYLSKTVERERSEIAANRNDIESLRTDTETKRTDLTTLTTDPTSFSATRCSTCGMSLDLPTVHFLCKHSFHQRCLNIAAGQDVEDVECPVCAPSNATMRQVKMAQEEYAQRQDLFRSEMGRSTDRFGTVSQWFGRGVMDTPTIADSA